MRNYSRPLPREAREGQEGEGESHLREKVFLGEPLTTAGGRNFVRGEVADK